MDDPKPVLEILVAVLATIQAVLAYSNLKPYVYVGKFSMGNFKDGEEPVVIVPFTNGGKTNASNVWINVTAGIVSSGDNLEIDESRTAEPKSPIVAGQTVDVVTSIPTTLDAGTISKLEHGGLDLLVVGYIEYTGLLGVRSDRQEFRRQYVRWKGGYGGRPPEVPHFTGVAKREKK